MNAELREWVLTAVFSVAALGGGWAVSTVLGWLVGGLVMLAICAVGVKVIHP